ncbi:MAG TPA: NAD(P)/FAD-dependent oxidoreductase [Terriglobia bacterium]|nr:NAD(P)/FAD-dependent oxidoreductase [Terriglobia bacterium]
MSSNRDAVIIGGGHNGLVTAFYLARAGLKPLVLERRPVIGGLAVTEEFHPGFKCPTLAHSSGPILPEIVADMALEQHGLQWVASETSVVAIAVDGRALVLASDVAKATAAIAAFSKKDAEKFGEFHRVLGRLAETIAPVLNVPPPEIDNPSTGDLWSLLQTGRRIRGLGEKDMYRLMRWVPMPIADLVSEWFETEILKATIAARGIFGNMLGPASLGSSAVLLLRAVGDPHPVGSAFVTRGGAGALTQAMAAAAQAAGAEIRTGAEIKSVTVKDGIATGVVLASGEEISASLIISNADPKRTLFDLVGPVNLDPSFVTKLRNYRCSGCVAKVNLALSGRASFPALKGSMPARIHIGPTLEYLERAFDAAKYGAISPRPILEVAIPSAADPSLAPAGKHVMSVYAQFAPYKLKEGNWHEKRDALGDLVVQTLAAYAPDLPGMILHRQVITPLDLEETYGLTSGHIFHGELSLDQLFAMRPVLGWGRYRTPIENLYLCGSGTHPGNGLTGASGRNAAREILKDRKSGKRN